jgi:hypothetical protein
VKSPTNGFCVGGSGLALGLEITMEFWKAMRYWITAIV